MSELGEDARELIERALRDEASADAAELQRIRRRVLAAGAGASIFGSVGKAVAMLGKASLGPAVKAFSVGVAVTVLALGIPTVLSSDKSPAPAEPRASSVAAPRFAERTPSSHDAPTQLPAEESAAAAEPSSRQAVAAAHSSKVRVEPAPRAPVNAAARATDVAAVAAPAPTSAETAAQTTTARSAAGLQETYSTPSSVGTPRQSSPLVQEITLLEKVQSELRAGRGRAALELLDRSAAPVGGQLGAERLAAEVFAACQAGEVARARAAARLFESKYASSPASARVRGSCAGEQGENAR